MAESPDGRGVILFGGHSEMVGYDKRILELRAGANSWNILNITLGPSTYHMDRFSGTRAFHVVIPLT